MKIIEENIEVTLREQDFHNAVREYIITGLLFMLLYVSSYALICLYRRRPDRDDIYPDDEDAMVYRISLWICTFTVAVSAGAVLLLPISIVSNEVLIWYPKSYYVQWLNSSLIQGLWNYIFLLSNLALFVLMPFAYFFTESEGFSGSKKGIMARVYEALVLLCLLAILVLGLAWVALALIDGDKSSRKTLWNIWSFYLPLLYSFISLLGVLMLLICTPVGFARLFTVVGQLVVKPQFLRDIEQEIHTVRFEEETLHRKLQYQVTHTIANGSSSLSDIQAKLDEVQDDRRKLEKRQKVSSLRRNLGYPLMMILLLTLTAISVLIVAQNSIELLLGEKALPVGKKETVLGKSSLVLLGPIGAILEIALILYLMCASVCGFYSIPVFCQLRPVVHDTTMTKIIGNSIVILVLSSALPVLSRLLGITKFDLLGDFGEIDWLGNFYIILTYNLIFGVATSICLVKKFTLTLRQEIYRKLGMAFRREQKRTISANMSNSSVWDNAPNSTVIGNASRDGTANSNGSWDVTTSSGSTSQVNCSQIASKQTNGSVIHDKAE